MDYTRAIAFFEGDGPYLLSTHVNADGDGIGALLGLSSMLDQLGKTNRIVVADAEPDRKFAFLEGFEKIESFQDYGSTDPVPFAVFVDTPTISAHRVGNVARLIDFDTRTMVIDHHAGGSEEGNVLLIDSGASAASELVFRMIQEFDVEITEKIATQIYTGIAFDTKLFKYSHPERALRAAAELVDYGADPTWIADELFAHQTFETVKTLGIALAGLELHADNRIVTVSVDHETYKLEGDLDGVVDQAMSIDGVEVALFFKEQSAGVHRVSLRSRGNINVNVIARKFGGGGHQNASGCTLEKSLGESIIELLEETKAALPG